MDITIRKIEKNDKNELFNMMKVFYASPAVLYKAPDDVLYTDIEECLKDDDLLTCFMILVKNKIAGYMMLSKSYSTEYGGICMWVEDCYIKPEFRKMGLGKKLFTFIENEYAGKIIKFKLEVEKNNVIAKSLYEKIGYENSDYIVMSKEM